MIELRMKGGAGPFLVATVIAGSPLMFCFYQLSLRHQPISPSMVLLCVAVAVMPALSRLMAKRIYRAAVDDICLHVGGEALPWNKITRIVEQHSWRRSTMTFFRGRTIAIQLVVRDFFAGHLEPLSALTQRLNRHLPLDSAAKIADE